MLQLLEPRPNNLEMKGDLLCHRTLLTLLKVVCKPARQQRKAMAAWVQESKASRESKEGKGDIEHRPDFAEDAPCKIRNRV